MQYSEIIFKLFRGHNLWVEFTNPKEARRGSIGRLVRKQIEPRIGAKIDRELTDNPYSYHSYTLYKEYPHIEVEFPGLKAKSIVIPQTYDFRKIKVLVGYTGPAVRTSTPVEKAKPGVFVDKFGVTAAVGDFISFIHRGDLCFGTITKLGTAEAKWLYFRDIDGHESYFIAYPSTFAVVDKDFRTRMMIRKLGKR